MALGWVVFSSNVWKLKTNTGLNWRLWFKFNIALWKSLVHPHSKMHTIMSDIWLKLPKTAKCAAKCSWFKNCKFNLSIYRPLKKLQSELKKVLRMLGQSFDEHIPLSSPALLFSRLKLSQHFIIGTWYFQLSDFSMMLTLANLNLPNAGTSCFWNQIRTLHAQGACNIKIILYDVYNWMRLDYDGAKCENVKWLKW